MLNLRLNIQAEFMYYENKGLSNKIKKIRIINRPACFYCTRGKPVSAGQTVRNTGLQESGRI
jgi:hypothetical protein